MTSVASPTIRAIGYRERTRELWVDYHSGETRIYESVGRAQVQRLMAGSNAVKGQYLAEMVRDPS